MTFFVLSDPVNHAALRVSTDLTHASLWEAALRGVNPTTSLRAQQSSEGRQRKEVIWNMLAVGPLVSDRVITILRESAATGWITFPVGLTDAAGEVVSGYSGLGITGRCNDRIEMDKREAAIVYKPSPVTGKPLPHFRGVHFDIDAWDGSDFFMGTDTSTKFIVVTERIAKLFGRYKVRNCLLTPVEAVELLAGETEIIRGLATSTGGE